MTLVARNTSCWLRNGAMPCSTRARFICMNGGVSATDSKRGKRRFLQRSQSDMRSWKPVPQAGTYAGVAARLKSREGLAKTTGTPTSSTPSAARSLTMTRGGSSATSLARASRTGSTEGRYRSLLSSRRPRKKDWSLLARTTRAERSTAASGRAPISNAARPAAAAACSPGEWVANVTRYPRLASVFARRMEGTMWPRRPRETTHT